MDGAAGKIKQFLNRLISPDSLLLASFILFYILITGSELEALGGLYPWYKFCLSFIPGLLVGYFLLNFLQRLHPAKNELFWSIKYIVIGIVIVTLVFMPASLIIITNQLYPSSLFAHDGLIQSQQAVAFLLDGRNPYTEDYALTDMARVSFRVADLTYNPGFKYYAYMPLMFLSPLPFQLLGEKYLGWFDHRMIYLSLFMAILILISVPHSSAMRRAVLLICLGLCPFFAMYLLDGRNDVMVLFWMVCCLFALKKGQVNLSAVFLALACCTKQLAWLYLPFYLLLVSGAGDWRSRLKKVSPPLIIISFIGLVIVLPWLIWDGRAFYQSTFAYLSGMLPDGYPINGIGFSAFLWLAGYFKSVTDPFPFVIVQLVLTIPVMVLLVIKQLAHNTLRRSVLNYCITLGIYLFFSRAFNFNYVGFLLAIYVLGTYFCEDLPLSQPTPDEITPSVPKLTARSPASGS